ncbi:probable GIM3-Gim complex component [Serendipita indica DSM 11827]|uniref:Prefoldin subunit 4 n=1 Tax=Serendipita indica (strain DSM 11827) TaxID=1109443 RepID=G4TBD7_SERID|nr:probable GIM3-Gim complex component [Serendipita indica DSM 11827]
MRMLSQDEEKDADVEVNWEDQQRINTFSKTNTRFQNLQEELEVAKKEKEALEDITTELELADEDQPVLYRVGEAFVHLPLDQAQKRLAADAEVVEAEVARLQDALDMCQSTMKELKLQLYAKFGTSINLD